MSPKPGWKILGLDATIRSVTLTTNSDTFDQPITSQPLVIQEQTRSGGTFEFQFGKMGPTIMAISGHSDLSYGVAWEGPAVVHMRNPQGEVVHVPLPARSYFPVSMSDDCTDRVLDGAISVGPLDLELETSFGSPGC